MLTIGGCFLLLLLLVLTITFAPTAAVVVRSGSGGGAASAAGVFRSDGSRCGSGSQSSVSLQSLLLLL